MLMTRYTGRFYLRSSVVIPGLICILVNQLVLLRHDAGVWILKLYSYKSGSNFKRRGLKIEKAKFNVQRYLLKNIKM